MRGSRPRAARRGAFRRATSLDVQWRQPAARRSHAETRRPQGPWTVGLGALCASAGEGLTDGASATSGLSTLNKDQIAERGARMARRDDREYREYLREEQRRQPGCPAREVVLDQRGQATRSLTRNAAPVVPSR